MNSFWYKTLKICQYLLTKDFTKCLVFKNKIMLSTISQYGNSTREEGILKATIGNYS